MKPNHRPLARLDDISNSLRSRETGAAPVPLLRHRKSPMIIILILQRGLAALLALGVAALAAPADATRAYDLPADAAEVSLKEFAAKSGRSVIFSTDSLAGLRTNAIQGTYTARAALDLLLAGTGLEAVPDAKTDSIGIRRIATPSPNPVRRAPSDLAPGAITGRMINERTGEYIERAQVRIEGSDQEVFTDTDGYYRLARVAPGAVRIRVFFTGLPPHFSTRSVAPGQTLVHDISLGGVSSAAERAESVVKLANFVVATSREMTASAIAINEQRFAPNIKNVLSTDEFGFLAEGNAADFLKFLPGVTIDYTGGNARDVSINGVPSAYVPISLDGFNLASSGVAGGNMGRAVAMDMVSVNNLARIEVEYSPTPESQGAALAGTINMVPRSAFERSRPVFNGSAYFMARSNARGFRATPGPRNKDEVPIYPGFDFSYVAPVNKRFGYTLSGGTSTNYTAEPFTQMLWRGATAATDGGAFPHTTPDRPYLTTYIDRDGGNVKTRSSFSATADFRLGPSDRLAVGFQYSYFHLFGSNQAATFTINRVQTGAFSPNAVRSAPGAADLTYASLGRDRHNRTSMPTLVWRHDGPDWKADAGLGRSVSTNANRDIDKGLFNITTGSRRNVTIAFDQIERMKPGVITVTDAATGTDVNPFKIDGVTFNTATASQDDNKDLQHTAYANIAREFHGRVPFRLKGGVHLQRAEREISVLTSVYTFLGPDGVAGSADDGAAPFLDQTYARREGVYYGQPPVQGVSTFLPWERFKANPSQFRLDTNGEYRSAITNSKMASELISAAFLRGDLALLDRRLKLVGGLRAEQTNVEAEGPLTDPTRNYQRNAAGNVILVNGRPALIFPVSNALEVSRLTFIERGLHADKEFLRLFPSINASFTFRENLIGRVAFYRSIGRPSFGQYAGALTLPDTEELPSQTNRIQVNNVGIKAWSANTVNLRLEYYFEGVGQITLNAFRRDFENFFGATRFPATPEFLTLYGIDERIYGAFDVQTQYNVPGTVRMEGASLDYRQALTFLPHWARGLQVFANASTQRSTGSDVGAANFNFYPRSGNWGVTLTREKFQLRFNWNYRGLRRGAAVTGASLGSDTFNWTPPSLRLDAGAEYHFRKRFALFASLRNATSTPQDAEIYGSLTPDLARFRSRNDYPALWTIGVKGTY